MNVSEASDIINQGNLITEVQLLFLLLLKRVWTEPSCPKEKPHLVTLVWSEEHPIKIKFL